jgi:phage gp36-like protein
MTEYCTSGDLLVGDVPIPAYLDKEKIVTDASEEIDTYLGFKYITPIVVENPEDPTNRPVVLLLKRINAHLATGRLILEAAIAAEDDNLHAYGKRLIDESLALLIQIQNGEVVLPGAPIVPGLVGQENGPLQLNHEPFSYVDALYDGVLFAPPRCIPRHIFPD